MFILILFSFFAVVYWYGVKSYNYWSNKGIKHERPVPYFGNNSKQYLQQSSVAMLGCETYRKFPEEKVVGFYRGLTPELLIRDPEIIKRILITDFQYFYPRGFNPHPKVIDPLLRNLFFADGDMWKLLRQRISPAFSTGKLKAMFPHITQRAEKLQEIADTISSGDGECDVRELMARYTTDFIGACGFGINMDSLSDNNSEFRKLGKRIFQRTFRDVVAGVSKQVLPEIFKHVKLLSPEIELSMMHLVSEICKERNYKPSGKNDFIDLMLELKQSGAMVGESLEKKNPDGTPAIVSMELDDILITAQVFVFFGAGFETSSSASSYTLHQLAFNPKCQAKAQAEIDRVLAKYEGKITYDAVREMTYLEMAFNEGLRMYPSVGFLMRKCATPEYTIPEVGITITEGVNVFIPVKALHNDEKYFRNPDQFDPERFNPESKRDIKKFAYIPFGEGPRACVGARLGQMQSMAGLAAVLQKFTVEPASTSLKTPIPDPTAIVAEGIVGGLPLKLRRRVMLKI